MGPVKNPAQSEPGGAGQQWAVPVKEAFLQGQPAGSSRDAFPVQSSLPVSLALSNLTGSPGDFSVEVFKQAALTLGLPQDILSFTLIAFTRLFSLSADSGLLGGLRREVLAGAVSAPKNNTEKTKTETRALAATAAAAKGLSLSPEALEKYAGLLGAEYGDGRKDGQGAEADDGSLESGTDGPNAGELRRLFDEFMETGGKDQILPFLNRIPAKDGRHWVFWPFNIRIGGVDLRVSVRILKREEITVPDDTARLIADITGPQRRWRFIVDSHEDGLKTVIQVYPAHRLERLKALQREAEKAFSGFSAGIGVENGGDEFLPGLYFPDEVFPAVNEEANLWKISAAPRKKRRPPWDTGRKTAHPGFWQKAAAVTPSAYWPWPGKRALR
jgi:hypothetical protein